MFSPNLSIDDIISQYGELSIYRLFIKEEIEPNKPVLSPLRTDDTKPSLGLYWYNNSLLYKDFGHSAGNVFQFVMRLHNCDFQTAVKIINQKIKGGNIKPNLKGLSSFKEKSTTIYKYEPYYIEWSDYDKHYWYTYKITLDYCNKFKIRPVLSVKCNDYYLKNIYQNSSPFYAYHVNDHFRFYKPFSEDYKWLGNLNKNDIYGLAQLKYNSDILFITSSLKDVMILDILNYNAIAPSSESTFIPERILFELMQKYKYLYIYYDNDASGIQYSKKYQSKYNISYINNPHRSKCKDPSDLAKKENLNMVNLIIKNKINERK